MAGLNSKTPKLPKSVLDMKFMKKTRDRIAKELENTEGHDSLYSNIITDEMRHASGNFISESSFLYCDNLIEGRLSFKGMNPEIERLMEIDNSIDNAESNGDMQKDISDESLAVKMEAFNEKKRKYRNSPLNVQTKKKKYVIPD